MCPQIDRSSSQTWAPQPGQPGDWRFLQADPKHQREALALLLTGRRNPQDRSVDTFLSFAKEHALCVEHLYVAELGGRPSAAALLVPGAGRTGMLFLSPLLAQDQVGLAAGLIGRVLGLPLVGEMALVQSLLEPGQRLHQQALEMAGFHRLAQLNYMQSRRLGSSAPLRLADPAMQAVAWAEQHRELFGRAILASYAQTRDCPGLVGLRSIEDILAGHQAAGVFEPRWWWAVRRGDEPVAVALVNRVQDRDAGELVYLGVAPRWRGKALAHRLLQHALGELAQANLRAMLLAVDEQNAPAIRLYRQLGFHVTGHKLAMIYSPAKDAAPKQPQPGASPGDQDGV